MKNFSEMTTQEIGTTRNGNLIEELEKIKNFMNGMKLKIELNMGII